ncbi:oxidase [Polynucleobacter antarcticus]|uniref:Oxidase n=1 Tax=Polynucleobacter antarcticus TaxID=1743162 RepID=A0A6M9PK03_9BURK|nr:oxidase [Polynucleobacter antarcticus]
MVKNQLDGISDRIAYCITRSLRFLADTFFSKRYGHRAVVLETVAAVPGMVSGMWIHLKSLRETKTGYGPKIRTLLGEAENERMHLMTFIDIAQPTKLERSLILFAQFLFWHFYFVLFVFAPRTAHRMIGYFEEEAVISYTQYLEQVDAHPELNIAAPKIAIDYWKLPADARLRDVIIAVRADEQGHSEVNHAYADEFDLKTSK